MFESYNKNNQDKNKKAEEQHQPGDAKEILKFAGGEQTDERGYMMRLCRT